MDMGGLFGSSSATLSHQLPVDTTGTVYPVMLIMHSEEIAPGDTTALLYHYTSTSSGFHWILMERISEDWRVGIICGP
jgi:hypothetical protein